MRKRTGEALDGEARPKGLIIACVPPGGAAEEAGVERVVGEGHGEGYDCEEDTESGEHCKDGAWGELARAVTAGDCEVDRALGKEGEEHIK